MTRLIGGIGSQGCGGCEVSGHLQVKVWGTWVGWLSVSCDASELGKPMMQRKVQGQRALVHILEPEGQRTWLLR